MERFVGTQTMESKCPSPDRSGILFGFYMMYMSGAPPAMGAEEHEPNENNSQKDTSEEQEIAS